jgi:hypothetical protein
MTNTSWADLNIDGRRLEKIIKDMNAKQEKESDFNLRFAYIDRLIKATNTKVNIAEIVLNVKRILKEAEKNMPKGELVVNVTT